MILVLQLKENDVRGLMGAKLGGEQAQHPMIAVCECSPACACGGPCVMG